MTEKPANHEAADDPLHVVAQKIVRLGMATPAILFIDSAKPLGFITGQFLRVLEPGLSLFFRAGSVSSFAAALEERSGVERLVREIERLAGDRDEGPGHEGS